VKLDGLTVRIDPTLNPVLAAEADLANKGGAEGIALWVGRWDSPEYVVGDRYVPEELLVPVVKGDLKKGDIVRLKDEPITYHDMRDDKRKVTSASDELQGQLVTIIRDWNDGDYLVGLASGTQGNTSVQHIMGLDVDLVTDTVQSPAHYTEGRTFEPAVVIRQWGLPFTLGSAVKYISRAGRKDDTREDLQKAIRFIELEEEALATGTHVYPMVYGPSEGYGPDPVLVAADWDLSAPLIYALHYIVRSSGSPEFLKIAKDRLREAL
jgi:hypothetical protein